MDTEPRQSSLFNPATPDFQRPTVFAGCRKKLLLKLRQVRLQAIYLRESNTTDRCVNCAILPGGTSFRFDGPRVIRRKPETTPNGSHESHHQTCNFCPGCDCKRKNSQNLSDVRRNPEKRKEKRIAAAIEKVEPSRVFFPHRIFTVNTHPCCAE